MSLLSFVVPLGGAALLSWVLSWSAWRHRRVPGRQYFSFMLGGIGLWCAFYALESAVPGLAAKTAFAKVEYLGIVSVPVLWFLFSLRYTARDSWLTRKRAALFFVLPGLTLLLVATNELHHLMWKTVALDQSGPFPALAIAHGPFFWIHLAYSYLLILAGAGTLIWSVVRYPRNYRGQAVLIIVAAVAPWVANLLYAFGIAPDGNLDLTPFAFALTGALLALAMSRYRLLDLFLGLRTRARSALIEKMPDGVIVVDEENRIVDFNPAASSILGGPNASLLGARMQDLMQQPCAASELSGIDDVHCELELGEGGEPRTFDMLASRLGGQDSGPSGRLVVLRDVTERRRAEQAALESERRYRTLVDNAHDLILTLDPNGRFTSVNPAVERVTGYTRKELLARTLWDVVGRGVLAEAKPLLLDGEGQRREILLKSKSGADVVLEASIRGVSREGELSGYECIARDVTESRAWEEALRFQALHDSVTSLPNRMNLREHLQELVTSPASPNKPFALFVLDLDDFKRVNDNLGHHCGDALLALVAARLGRSIRSADIIARLGGDEFALVVSADDVADACRIALRILGAFKSPFKVERQPVGLAASVGIALYPDHGSTVDSLLRFADIAMYAAKRAGGSRYAIYELADDHHSPDRLSLQADLHRAFSGGELTLYYQPQVNLRLDRVVAVEALVRWNHPRRGLILPSEFIDLLEQDGLADTLTRWALAKALTQCASWRSRGLETRVSVNLSARNLDDPDLPELISRLIREHKAEPGWLTVELTESSVMLEPERAIGVLGAIRELGVRVAIDDFGAGHSALPYLKTLPANEVKIDKSFVISMTVDKGDAAIVRSTIGLAHELGLTVVAEGVENEATKRLLGAYGCDIGQGYFLGRPVRPASVAGRLRPADAEHRPARSRAKRDSEEAATVSALLR